MAGIGTQAIKGKDQGDRVPEVEASKALAATKTRAYQFKTYTVPGGGFSDQDLSSITADAPNAAENLFSQFNRAQRIFVRSSVDASIKLGDNADAIPILVLQGGQFEETHIEFEKVLLTAPAGAVVDVLIS